MTDETQAAEPQDEPVTSDGAMPSGETADGSISDEFTVTADDEPTDDDDLENIAAEQPVQLGAVEDAAPHPGVFRLEHAQGLPEVPADTPTWAHYAPPAGAITRFKSVDRRTMEVVMLADEGRGLAARQA